MGLISCAQKYPVSTFHPKNPALQDSILVFNQDCELVSQLPIFHIVRVPVYNAMVFGY